MSRQPSTVCIIIAVVAISHQCSTRLHPARLLRLRRAAIGTGPDVSVVGRQPFNTHTHPSSVHTLHQSGSLTSSLTACNGICKSARAWRSGMRALYVGWD
ncbi:hypothetical protein B0T16DRAFT_81650 [Cercophora newfieldiana]|uniref:Uncharacterized protein n=1 Tax=Cercophora newfieldiana TaxID=92897 RepID=A0AA40CWA5_9PEZI|nr:hypothetical protein B0T16DRAFT_81650 [Cercophora newfieldiana]